MGRTSASSRPPDLHGAGRSLRLWLAPSAFFPHRGGVEELTLKLGQHLASAGHDVTVLTNRWPAHLPAREQIEGLEVRRLPFVLQGRHPRSWAPYARSRRHVAAALSRLEPPDLVHVQCPSSQTPHLARYARSQRVPLVVTTQGETYMDAGDLYGSSLFARRALRRAARQAAALTACSRHAADGASRIAPAFAGAVVVPNAVDPNDWTGLPTVEEPVLAAWGRHVPQKGFDLLLHAFRRLRVARPEARLLLGGDGPQTPDLRRLAGEGVDFVGPLDRAGVRHLLARCRVAVVPSRVEPFGIVALEALAAGRGLVYSTRGGLPEAAGDAGRGADPFDVDDFAAALRAELDAPTPLHDAQARAARFTWRGVVGDYLDVYARSVSR